MMRRALAIALLGLGVSFSGNGPANAAGISAPGIAAPLTNVTGDAITRVGGCPLDLPVVSGFVAFFELLTHEEGDRHCYGWRFHGERYYRRTYAHRAPLK